MVPPIRVILEVHRFLFGPLVRGVPKTQTKNIKEVIRDVTIYGRSYRFAFRSNRSLDSTFATFTLLSNFSFTSSSSQFTTMSFRSSSAAIALFTSYTGLTVRPRITGLARLAWRSNIALTPQTGERYIDADIV